MSKKLSSLVSGGKNSHYLQYARYFLMALLKNQKILPKGIVDSSAPYIPRSPVKMNTSSGPHTLPAFSSWIFSSWVMYHSQPQQYSNLIVFSCISGMRFLCCFLNFSTHLVCVSHSFSHTCRTNSTYWFKVLSSLFFSLQVSPICFLFLIYFFRLYFVESNAVRDLRSMDS